MNYYYLVSSLPSLALETEPPISFDEFLLLCSEHLTAGDMANLKTLDSGKTGRSRFARTWRECESVLRNALVKVRAARLKTDPEKYTRETATLDMRAEKTAAEALAKENPLDREMLLDRFRWQQAEELAGFNPFSSDAVMAYAFET